MHLINEVFRHYPGETEPSCVLMGIQMVQPPWKTVGQFLSNLNIELPYDPTIPLLGMYLKELESRCSNKNVYRNVYRSTTHNSQKVETTQRSIQFMNR